MPPDWASTRPIVAGARLSAGTYKGYQAYYTGITGQSFTSEEVDVSSSNEIEKVVYSGMTSTPYSSVSRIIPTARSPTRLQLHQRHRRELLRLSGRGQSRRRTPRKSSTSTLAAMS